MRLQAFFAILRTRSTRFGRLLPWSVLILAVVLLTHHLLTRAYVSVDVVVDRATTMAMYWAGEGQNYSESRVTYVKVSPNKSRYGFLIGDLRDIRKVRFDPAAAPANVRLKRLAFTQYGFDDVVLDDADDLARLEPLRQIAGFEVTSAGARIVTSGGDPQLQLVLDAAGTGALPSDILVRSLVIILLLAAAARVLPRISTYYAFVPYAMLLALIVIFQMALTSRINAHPDEYVHIRAAGYYVDHHAPPSACDEDTLHTYSPYGVSRLNSTEVYYYLTGKFASLSAVLPIDESLRLRLFNVFLFAILLILAIRSVPFRIACIPLLLSPQVWYMFSYVNSEALAIFAGMLGVYQLIAPGSLLQSVLIPGRRKGVYLAYVGLGVLVALLLLTKKNFLLVAVLLAIWLFWHVVRTREYGGAAAIRRILPVVLVGATLSGLWMVAHEWANGFERDERIAQCRLDMAKPAFSEGTPVEKTFPTLYWRAKGQPLSALFEHGWGEGTFVSFVGHFGYLELRAGDEFYRVFAWLYAALVVYLLTVALRRGDGFQRGLVLLAVLLALTNLGASVWNSWVNDFQAQGRYLFPVIPILGLTLATLSNKLNERVIVVLALAMVALSFYFFVFVGLEQIRKY